MSGVLAACSDWHGGSGIENLPAQRRIVEIVCRRRPDAGVWCGDLVDLWRHRDALQRYAPFLIWACEQFRIAEVPVYYVLGNHDWCDPQWMEAQLRALGIADVEVHAPELTLGGWTFAHGHRFGDAMNDDRTALSSVAKGIVRGTTWLADHVWAGFEGSRLDPRRWISPSARGDKAVRFVHEAAVEYAARHQI